MASRNITEDDLNSKLSINLQNQIHHQSYQNLGRDNSTSVLESILEAKATDRAKEAKKRRDRLKELATLGGKFQDWRQFEQLSIN